LERARQDDRREVLPAINIGYGGVAMLHGSAVMNMENDSVFGMPVWKDIYLQQ
jgi:hypothetical protein